MEPQQKLAKEPTYAVKAQRQARSNIISVQVDVTPQKKTTKDGNIVLLGYLQDTEVEVVFKHDGAIHPLLTYLNQMIKVSRSRASAAGRPAPHVSNLRCPLNIEGFWKVRLIFDTDDMPQRRYQLHATRWRVRRTENGESISGQRQQA
ncbi:MAG: hypothetical protein OIF48_02410 [Silicimonas sp.]|nr:hypothetical protein [Silicimonas sp.]